MKRAAVVCLFAAILGSLSTAASAEDDFQTWGAVVATGTPGRSDNTLRYWLEGQGRFNDDSSRFGQGILRAGLGRALSPHAALWGGYAFIPTDPRGRGDDIVEHRLWQQWTWNPPSAYAGLNFNLRSRLEQRWIESADDLGWRARQLVKLTRPLGDGSRFYLSLWDELFVNINSTDWGASSGFDQNRAFLGLGTRLAAGARLETGYLYQLVGRDAAPDRHHHILSLTLLLDF